jgi:hypothetical protein
MYENQQNRKVILTQPSLSCVLPHLVIITLPSLILQTHGTRTRSE